MRTAIVDIGSNSTRLLIAEVNESGDVEVVKTGLITTRIGEGIGKQSNLVRLAMERTIDALLVFQDIIMETGAETVSAAATSAVRDAANRAEFLSEVRKQVGWDIRVLSGAEEAELSYLGATRGLNQDIPSPVVIDIGGGSTEFIWSAADQLNCRSQRLGAVRMTENNSSFEEIKELLAGILSSVNSQKPKSLVGVGGTLTTLAAVDQKLMVYDPAKVHGYCLYRQKVKEILQLLEGMTIEKRRTLPGLMPERADIIVAGVRIALAIMEGLHFDRLTVSESDILYGLLYQQNMK